MFAYTFTVTNDQSLSVSPNNAIVSNAITETISVPGGYSSVQYSLNGGNWTDYTGPFTIDGNNPNVPVNAGFGATGANLAVRFYDGSMFWTNSYIPAYFMIAPLVASPVPNIGDYYYQLEPGWISHCDGKHRHRRRHHCLRSFACFNARGPQFDVWQSDVDQHLHGSYHHHQPVLFDV